MIDTINKQLVGTQADRVLVLRTGQVLTAPEARAFAAWLLCMADVVEPAPEHPFDEVLRAIQNT